MVVDSKRIRVALVVCDTHGYYHGTLMSPCDPVIFVKHNKIVHQF